MRYTPANIEPKWQSYWDKNATFHVTEDPNKPKFYALCMFPYPSGSGLHVGHPESYTAIDIVARYKRMTGHAVLNPIGFDSFGLPTERAAIRDDRHPKDITEENIAYFRTQMKRLGFSFNWEREIKTSNVDFYKWTQWIFLKLHEQGLAYLAEIPVNWCPAQGTVLANEEVQDGRYIETGDPVERRVMKQWMLKITAYAERLLEDLDDLDWPEGILEMQRNWIGKSEGAEVDFAIQDHDAKFTVFTTRPDTLFGATYCVLAPEHPLIDTIVTADHKEAVNAYVAEARNRSDMDRQKAAEKEKTGVFTGAYAINPANGKPVAIWVADYVLMTYGTGAIMAVPAHDARDHAFATKFGINIVEVIGSDTDVQAEPYTGDGVMVNSGEFNGLDGKTDGKTAVTAWLAERGSAKATVNYKLRDWLFSRQRYWGEPFPIVHTEDGGVHRLDPSQLPVELPEIDAYKPTADGAPPLARAEAWLTTTHDGKPALRETNTMPQWAGSCWYYLRYMDPHNTELPFAAEKEAYWGPVDLYIGGVEHAVLHLLYARFWHKVLFDCGVVSSKEPFTRLFNQGMILAFAYREAGGKYHHPDNVQHRKGEMTSLVSAWSGDTVETDWYVTESGMAVEQKLGKMGKSLNNSVDPLDIVEAYGADTLRIYEMFMGPLEQVKPWQTSGCDGIQRFLGKVWRLFVDQYTGETRPFGESSKEVHKALHIAIQETTEGIEQLKLNTPVAKMMEFVNTCGPNTPNREDAEAFVLILSTYAPHIAEELWERFGHTETLTYVAWPTFDPSALVDDEVEIVVQVMGKKRASILVPKDASKEDILAIAKADDNVARHLEGKTIRKEIVVPGRLVNFVAN
jgi:leucyl-tRNA synthetase